MNKYKSYEQASEQVLPEGLPIIARLDGNNFSELTDDHFHKPFDEDFEWIMNMAAKSVMQYCTNATLAYIQSDEINLLIPPKGDPFLANRTQKLSSLLAGHCSSSFTNRFGNPAAFDCRVFVMPENEVLGYFNWRQETAWSNCLHSTAYYELADEASKDFAQERLKGADNSEKQEILFNRFGINANDIPTHRKRGRCLRREKKEYDIEEWVGEDEFERLKEKGCAEEGQVVERKELELDNKIPLFSKNRRYIDYAIREPIPPVA